MAKIIFLHSVLNTQQVFFINQVAKQLEKEKIHLLLVGWDEKGDLDLHPEKVQLPVRLTHFNVIFQESQIKEDFERYGLDVDFLVNRFNWWFPEPEVSNEYFQRKAFLHYHLIFFVELIKVQQPSLILIWNGNDPRQFILSHLCKIIKIKHLFLERGTLPSLLFYDVKGVLCHSTVASLKIDSLTASTSNRERLKIYENWYYNTSETLWEQPAIVKEINFRSELGIKPDQKVILFVGQVDNDIQSKLFSPYFTSNIEAFKWFLQFGKTTEYFILGKHHPKSSYGLSYYQEVIGVNKNVIWTDKIPLDECLKLADYVVAVNSSVIFDALMWNKPVLSLGTTILDGKNILYEYDPKNIDYVLHGFYRKDELHQKIENFKKLLGFLLCNNFIFLKDHTEALKFSNELVEMKKTSIKRVVDIASARKLELYLKNVKSNSSEEIKKNPPTEFLKKIILKIIRKLKFER